MSNKIVGIVVGLFFSILMVPISGVAATKIETFSSAFPDSHFRTYINQNVFTTPVEDTAILTDANFQELANYAPTRLDVSNKEIDDLTGISYLTSVTDLDCSGNKLLKIDISALTKLVSLDVSDNYITTLNISGLKALTTLHCNNNGLLCFNLSNYEGPGWIDLQLKKSILQIEATQVGEYYGVKLLSGASVPISGTISGFGNYYSVTNSILWTSLLAVPSKITYQYMLTGSNELVSVDVYVGKTGLLESVIKPVVPASFETKSGGYNSIKLTWNYSEGATGYRIYRSTSYIGTFSLVGTVTGEKSSSFSNEKLTCGKKYYYRIRAYRTIGGNKYFSDYSSPILGQAIPAKPVLTLKKYYSTAIAMSWKKIAGATGYRIYHSLTKAGTYTKVKSITSGSTLSWIGTGLAKGKLHYYKIRAYRTVNGIRIYGKYSTVKSYRL